MSNVQVETPRPKTSRENTPWALDQLPPFPAMAARLMRLLAHEDVDVTAVGRLIAAEPVFATRLLEMANSPLFALTRQVKTISHAIVVVGLTRVKSITVTRALGDFVAPALQQRALRVCWQNSLAGALIAEKLARACHIDPDFAYVAGLLRDIGRLALLVKYPESYANLLAVSRENGFDLRATERDLFDIDHCEAGAWIMARMPFPPELGEVAANHHEPRRDYEFRLLHLVHIADQLADALGFAVLTAANQPTLDEILNELPDRFHSEFHFDPEEWKAEIESKIQAWN